MSRYKYTPEFKAKTVLEVLEGHQVIGEIAADNNLNPNMVRNWKNVGRKLVRSYMQEMGIFPIYPKPNLSKRNFKEGIMPYLLRNMHIYP